MKNIIKVGMADLNVLRHPGMLTTLGLGSCVGISLYDPITRVIGMAHIMLPTCGKDNKNVNIEKYADTAIDKMVSDMVAKGASKFRIIAKLAGGAQMFSFGSSLDILKIGFRNVVAAKECLDKYRIPVVSEDTGGNIGRTIELYSEDGRLVIKTVGHGIKEI